MLASSSFAFTALSSLYSVNREANESGRAAARLRA
jgi:hypothetical protein